MPSAASLGLPQFGSRNVKIVTIPGAPSDVPGQRDNGKSFFLMEMSSRQAAKWSMRAFLALARAGSDIPAGIAEKYARAKGDVVQTMAVASLVGHMSFPELDPLMDELMGCVSFLINPGPPPVTRALNDAGNGNDDIAEIYTRHVLRAEVIELHVGFTLPAAVLNLVAAGSMMTEISETSPSTRTSRRRSRS